MKKEPTSRSVIVRTRRLRPLLATASAAGVAVAIAIATSDSVNPTASQAREIVSGGCPSVILYFSRGSGQALDTRERGGDERGLAEPGLALFKSLSNAYGAANVGSFANSYPAVNVNFRVRRIYLPSVDRGVRSAERNVTDLVRLCPRSQLVLGGYSQGAQAVHGALARLGASEGPHIAAVVLFGDPYFRARGDGIESEPSTSPAPPFDPARRGVAFSRLVRFPQPLPIGAGNVGKVFSWCHGLDPVCQGLEVGHLVKQIKGGTHFNYALDVGAATTIIVRMLRTLGVYPLANGKPAGADSYLVANTCHGSTCAVAEWSGPGRNGYKPVGALHEGQPVDVVCQVEDGEAVTGANGGASAIWDALANGAFIADYYTDTPGIGVRTPSIPLCEGLVTGSP
jgi:cutinase